ncbi:MAG: hypothetical protein KBS57_00710, partial [Alistipes sp.]|nr:hypothetical protein [Candidatus Minthomonas equi]
MRIAIQILTAASVFMAALSGGMASTSVAFSGRGQNQNAAIDSVGIKDTAGSAIESLTAVADSLE